MENKIIDKVKKLLALSNSSNEAEASSALAKAHALLAEHNLSMDSLADKSIIEEFTIETGSTIANYKKVVCSALAELNFCQILIRRKTEYVAGKGFQSVANLVIVGKNHNVLVTQSLIEYIVGSIERIAKRDGKGKGKSFITAFKFGMAINVSKRIQEIIAQDKKPDSGINALVVQEKSEIDNYLKDFDLKTKSVKASGDRRDVNAGFQAGEQISLNKQVQGSHASKSTLALS